jgi:hypothetical protein
VLVQEDEEHDNNSDSFAEILAGLLSDTEISESKIPFLTLSDGNENGDELNLIAGFSSENKLQNDKTSDFSDSAFPIENNSLNAEQLFPYSLELINTELADSLDDTIEIPLELSLFANEEIKDASSLVKKVENNSSMQPDKTEAVTETAIHVSEDTKNQAGTEKQLNDTLPKTDKAVSESANNVSMERARSENAQSSFEFSFNNKQEERPSARADELRNRSRYDRNVRSQGVFEIRDQRTHADQFQARVMPADAAMGRLANLSAQEITLELRLSDFNNAGQSAQTTWEAKASNVLENMLARELHQNFNGDIVRHATMALRDGGESIIRLNLKPETLGNVKILLEMTENKVTGIILVESEEALNAFRKEIASLEQAFKDSGFADANLDLSLSYGDNNSWQEYEENAFAPQMAASSYEDSLREIDLESTVLFDIYNRGQGTINVLA